MNTRPITIAGVPYRTLTEASAATGIPVSTLSKRRAYGEPLEGERPMNITATSVVVDGTPYPSIGAAARAHSLTRGLARHRIINGIDLSAPVAKRRSSL